MLCKVSPDSPDAKPIAWRTLAGTALASAAPGAQKDVSPAEIAQLNARIAELERLRQTEVMQAKQAGFAEGRQKALEESAAEVKAALDRLAQRLSEVGALRSKVRLQAEGDVVRLGLAIAQRILRREITADPDTLQGLVHAALQKIQNRDIVRVRVYPAGADALRAALGRAGAPPSVQVVADQTLKTGDLLFETSVGELDASVETQLQEVERGLADRLSLR